MNAAIPLACLAAHFLFSLAAAQDWPMWRGPSGNGVADPQQSSPSRFEKPLWEAKIRGRAHGSIAVRGDRAYFTAAVTDGAEAGQFIHCVDAGTGRELWKARIHEAAFTQKLNQKASWACATPAVDEKQVYINFLSGTKVWSTALSLEGEMAWQSEICDFTVHQGFGASPVLYGNDLLLVAADNKAGGVVCALERETGEPVWIYERDKLPNYVSPIVLKLQGKDQLVMQGTDKISSYDPREGSLNWETSGSTTECVTSVVTNGSLVFISGGYPKNHVAAVMGDGSGKVAWESPNRVYVPSLLLFDGNLYGVMDAGVAVCWNASTGEERWKARLGGNFSSSPVLLGDKIYAANESGSLFVYRADGAAFTLISETKIADEIFSSPAICKGRLYLRVADYAGAERMERVVCFE